jgi:hypothetical protein
MVPVVGVDHAPTTAFAAEAFTSLVPPISVPVREQLGFEASSFANDQGLENQPMVSDHAAVLTIVVANCWSLQHVSLGTHNPSSPSLPDAIIQVSRESEQNLSVSCFNRLPLHSDDKCRIQDSGCPGLLANSRNTLITGGTFVVSLSWGCINNQ